MAAPERKLIATRLNNLKPHERRFRANSGMGWAGEILSHRGDIMTLKNPRPFKGMPEGTPDLIGWDEITITQEMVGQKIAVFCGEEIKATGNLREKQAAFRDILIRMGGVFRILRG